MRLIIWKLSGIQIKKQTNKQTTIFICASRQLGSLTLLKLRIKHSGQSGIPGNPCGGNFVSACMQKYRSVFSVKDTGLSFQLKCTQLDFFCMWGKMYRQHKEMLHHPWKREILSVVYTAKSLIVCFYICSVLTS